MSGWWSGHKVLDPSELESRFSNEDSMAFMDAVINESMSEEGEALLDRVKSVVDKLPAREADFIEMYYFRNIKQTDIAAIFGVSQPTVCYRLQRAAARIHFLLSMPTIDPDEMRKSAESLLPDEIDVQILLLMYETTCQSEVAKRLGVSQGFVRHRFIRSLEKMRQHEDMRVYVELFDLISSNLNILREVQRPNWETKIVRIMA
jgi:DNA-directed RNA polymerase specialized sigma24 family protein